MLCTDLYSEGIGSAYLCRPGWTLNFPVFHRDQAFRPLGSGLVSRYIHWAIHPLLALPRADEEAARAKIYPASHWALPVSSHYCHPLFVSSFWPSGTHDTPYRRFLVMCAHIVSSRSSSCSFGIGNIARKTLDLRSRSPSLQSCCYRSCSCRCSCYK